MYQTIYADQPLKLPINPLILQEFRRHQEALSELFRTTFDTGTFNQVLEQAAFDIASLREIRSFLYGAAPVLEDPLQARRGIEALEELALFCRRYVMPGLRELLGISGFNSPRRTSADMRTLHAVKGLFAYTFPSNLEKMEEHTHSLKECLGLMHTEV